MQKFKNKDIAIDSMIVIYLIEGSKYSEKIAEILSAARTIHVSSLTYGEVLAGHFKQKNYRSIEILRQFLFCSEKVRVFDFNEESAELFAQIRANKPSLSPPDAINLASALHSGAHHFLTNDKTLKGIKDLSIIQLSTL